MSLDRIPFGMLAGDLTSGATGQVLGGGNPPEWRWRGWVQRAIGVLDTRLELPNTARIPGDDTKPQQSEGTEIVTCSTGKRA